MNKQKDAHNQAHKKRRRIFIAFTCAVVLVALLAVGFYFVKPAYLNHMAESEISLITGGQATVGSTTLGWNSITLKNVTIRTPADGEFARGQTDKKKSPKQTTTLGPKARNLFHARKITIVMHPWEVLFTSPSPDAVALDHPTLFLTENLDRHRFNYQDLNPIIPGGKNAANLPKISMSQASIIFGQVKNGHYGATGIVPIKGSFKSSDASPHTYRFSISQLARLKKTASKTPQATDHTKSSSQKPLPKLTGSFDNRTGQINIQIKNFRFTPLQRYLIPGKWSQWWKKMNPKGSLPTFNVHLGINSPDGLHIISANIIIHNLSLSLPLNTILRPRIYDVNGEFAISNNTVHIKNLRGRIAGLTYSINGIVHGMDPDAAFDITAKTGLFTIPKSPWYIFALPKSIRKKYQVLNPSGTFKIQIHFVRKHKNGPFTYSGKIHLIDAGINLDKLPYPIDNLKGIIQFNQHQVTLGRITGKGPSGASITVDGGTITPLKHHAKVRMRIEAWNIPVDHFMLDALIPKYRKSILRFNATPNYVPGQKGSVPPEPKTNIIKYACVEVRSDPKIKTRTHILTTTTLNMAGCSGALQEWPYPFTCKSGKLIIAPYQTIIDHMSLVGPTGATAMLNGTVDTGDNHDHIDPHVKLTHLKMPLDKVLLESLPAEQKQKLDRLNIHGTLVGSGKILNNSKDQIDFNTELTLASASAKPQVFNNHTIELSHINSKIWLSREKLKIQKFTSDYAAGKINIKGLVSWPKGASNHDIQITARRIPLDDPLKRLLLDTSNLKKRTSYLLNTYKPAGILNGTLHYTNHKNKQSYQLAIAPEKLTLTFGKKQVQLNEISGNLTATKDKISFNSLKWHWHIKTGKQEKNKPKGKTPSQAGLNGTINLVPDININLNFTAKGKNFGALEQTLLPSGLTRTLNNLDWQGGYKIEAANLTFIPANSDQAKKALYKPNFKLNAKMQLLGNSLKIGVPVTNLKGLVHLNISKRTGANRPDFTMTLQNARADIWGRTISRLSLKLANNPKTQQVNLQTLRGNIYGGVITGAGTIHPNYGGNYAIRLVMQHANFNQIVTPPHQSTSKKQTAPLSYRPQTKLATSSMSASLTLKGSAGKISKRHGFGVIRIHGDELYSQPLSIALLQAANLSIPSPSPINMATIDFMVLGDEVHLEPIRLQSPSLTIVGGGTMMLPSTKLHLKMVSRNSTTPFIGPLSEMINIFKDELVSIEVTGTLTNPKTQTISLEGVLKTWNQIFSEPND